MGVTIKMYGNRSDVSEVLESLRKTFSSRMKIKVGSPKYSKLQKRVYSIVYIK